MKSRLIGSSRCIWPLLIGISLLLVGCTPPIGEGVTLQRVADQASKNFTMGRQLKATSQPQIHATTSVSGGKLVLASYEAEQHGTLARVTMVQYMQRTGLGWTAGSGGFDVVPLAEGAAPIDFILGSGDPQGAFAYAGGLVRDPSVVEVAVTFVHATEPSVRVVVPVQEGTYLASQEGMLTADQIEALDATGRVLYSRVK